MDRDLLTLDELSQRLRVQPSWLYRRTRETGPDAIPRIKVGKYLRFDFEAVMEWLQKQNARGRK